MMQTAFTIADMARLTGLTYDTIRFYEKSGLLPRAKRKENGQRVYNQLDLDRILFVIRLKRTRMPLKTIKQYLTLVSNGDLESGYRILSEHKTSIESQMADMRIMLDAINYKLGNYRTVLEHSGLQDGPKADDAPSPQQPIPDPPRAKEANSP